LYRLAFDKYFHALTLKSDYHKADSNWKTALENFAQQEPGNESSELYRSAFEKYQQMSQLR
jgi:hypothetical protein